MAKNETKQQVAAQEEINETVSKAGQWIIDNQNILTWIICGIAAVILAVMAINNYVVKPNSLAASNENAKAVVYFNQGDFEKALNGDDADCMGFEEIASKYSWYQAGKLAALYAGVCYFNQGEFEEAAKYLKKFSADDIMVDPAANLLLGDAYVELDELGKAAAAFKAAAKVDNELIAPIALKKLGFVYLEQEDNAAAKKAFEQIKNDYPQSAEAQDIEKYIEIAK